MNDQNSSNTNAPSVRLSAKQAADRMGLTTQQLQALRLLGIGPPIVQKGLDIHYPQAEVVTIEEHEARAIFGKPPLGHE